MTAAAESAAGVAAPPAWTRRPANLATAVTAELVERIIRGVHPPGSPLPPEPVLCVTFSVSRTVVREAVKILQEKGLVQVRQGTGTMVTSQFDLEADIAGKTGTTQNNTDGWFILMHPNLVAGAWVGFNDARVTMRSDYWGQGGHNAILLVGDFFRDTFDANLIDTEAEFPRPERSSSLIVKTPQIYPEMSDTDVAALPPGYSTVVTSDGNATLVVGPDGIVAVQRHEAAATDDDDELGRFLNELNSKGAVASGNSATGGTRNAGTEPLFKDPNNH